MDLRTHYPYSLLRHGLVNSYPSLNKNLKTDVAIIGAGITGALMAWELQKKGIDCAVFDKRHVGMGSTAASTSLIQYEIDTPLHKLAVLVGYKHAVRSYERCRKAIDDLKQLCAEVNNKDQFEEKYSLQFASAKKDVAGLKKEYHLRKELGFKVDLLDARTVQREFGFDAPAALVSHEAAHLDAYLLTHKIFQKIHGGTVLVYDHTPVESIKHEKNKVMLKTGDGFTVTAKHLVIACGYESGRYIHKRTEGLRCTYAIISEPFQQEPLWKDNCLIWETADPYLYMRTTQDNRIMVGGKDTAYLNLKAQLDILPKKAIALQKSFQKLFPEIPFKIDFKWGGAFASTKDGLPYIGTIPKFRNTYFALGYGGNGITFSMIGAQMISKVICGKKEPDLELFSFNR